MDLNNKGQLESVGQYLDELLSDEERFEKSMGRMFDRLDAKIARGEAARN